VNKAQLVAEISERTGQPPAVVARVVEELIGAVRGSVARGERVVLSGFGTFHRQARARRVARNIAADEPVVVPPRNVPAFRPGKAFREAVARRGRRPRAAPRRGPLT
jgi:DNA-binding protein HU-beta